MGKRIQKIIGWPTARFDAFPPGTILPLIYADRKAMRPSARWAVVDVGFSLASGRRYGDILKDITRDIKKRATEDKN